jgi:hypothetical protein
MRLGRGTTPALYARGFIQTPIAFYVQAVVTTSNMRIAEIDNGVIGTNVESVSPGAASAVQAGVTSTVARSDNDRVGPGGSAPNAGGIRWVYEALRRLRHVSQ